MCERERERGVGGCSAPTTRWNLLVCPWMNEYDVSKSENKNKPNYFDFPFARVSVPMCLCCWKVHLGLCQAFCWAQSQWDLSTVTHSTLSLPLSATLWAEEDTDVHTLDTDIAQYRVASTNMLMLLLGKASESDLSLLQMHADVRSSYQLCIKKNKPLCTKNTQAFI